MSCLRHAILPALGARRVDAVKRADAAQWFHEYGRERPGGANWAHDSPRDMFRAIRLDTVSIRRRVVDGRDQQAERVAAAASVLEDRRAALAEAERVHQAESDALAHLGRTIAGHESRIEEACDLRHRDREAAARREREAAARRRKLIEDGLVAIGERGQ